MSAAKAWQRALQLTAPIAREPLRTFPVVVEEAARLFGERPALLSDVQTLSYRELDARANQYARWALAQGLGKGDTVGLLMRNRPEYAAFWLGLTRAGCVVALLNTNLTGSSLAHCVGAAAPAHIVADGDLAAGLHGTRTAAKIWAHGAHDTLPRIDVAVDREPREKPQALQGLAPAVDDTALLIYTSGTTGWPKAARVSHARVMQWSLWFAGMIGAGPDDRLYNVLPMYHSVGGVVALGCMLASGGSVVVRDGFSARHFWDELGRWDCTLFQYIGELCRYLLRAETAPQETEHRLRMCCGNGLRPDIWAAFQRRFRIPHIFEFYASTEGNVSLFNIEGKPGAVGRIPPYLAHRFPTTLIQVDAETGQPLRDPRGLCMPCAANEPGEALGRIGGDASSVGGRFEGYTSHEATQEKILRNVLQSGDSWFRTGDLMRRDEQGYFYFLDRLGDTFRWKGENVSTAEVAAALCAFPGVDDACVYGVAVPGSDGRAGMAALVAPGTLDLSALRRHIEEQLPSYARPLFLRVRAAPELTGTFKHAKQELLRQGFDPRSNSDPIFIYDGRLHSYVRIDAPLYEELRTGRLGL